MVTADRTGTVTLFYGDGDGTFDTGVAYAAASLSLPSDGGPDFVTLADLNRDGRLDIVVSTGHSSTVSVLLATCL